ncbi:MAG: hypothetical protein KBS74_08710 [Clostridiales bacterium]|nr:hypothetical protein [Candidatus Cacconaster stercorequi]
MKQKFSEKRKIWRDYARAIFLNYISGHPKLNATTYPAYFQQELGISDSHSYAKKMIRQGYLAWQEDDCVALTERGQAAIAEDYMRFFDFASPYVTIYDFLDERERMEEDTSFEATMLSLLLKQMKVRKAEGDDQSVKNIHFDIGALYEGLGYQEDALHHYLMTLYYDISGMEYYDLLVAYVAKKVSRGEAQESFDGVCVEPRVMEGLLRLKEVCTPAMLDKAFGSETIRVNLCSRKDFNALVEDIFNGAYEYDTWMDRFRANFAAMLSYYAKKKR